MSASGPGTLPNESRGRFGKGTLSDPRFTQMLASLGIEAEYIAEAAKFGKSIMASQARWSVRRSGLFGSRRLTKTDAHRVLKQELAKLAEVVA